MSKTRIYTTWAAMKDRCRNPKNKRFKHYGGRGIIVEWMDFFSFKNDMMPSFLETQKQNPNVKISIDRINNDGNYSKQNCRWATLVEQGRNRTNNRTIEVDGVSLSLSEWAIVTGLNRETLFSRVRRGWPPNEVLGKIRRVNKV